MGNMLISSSAVRSIALAVCLVAAGLITACNRGASDEKSSASIGTYKLGQEVQVGDLTYTVVSADWTDRIEGATPKNRFLVVRLSVRNRGNNTVPLRGLELVNAAGDHIQERTEGVENAPDYLGIMRNLEPGDYRTGAVVFDAPLAAYNLSVPDGGDIENERVAHIELPVQVEHPIDQPVEN
jgi:hypothetical protein